MVELCPLVQFVPGPPPLCLSRLMRFTQVCKIWRRGLEAGGFCGKTAHLCSALAGGGDAARLRQNARRRLIASTDDEAERAVCLDGAAFLAKSEKWQAQEALRDLPVLPSLREWLQAASQEPDASFLSRGAASTAQSIGLALVQWVGKPQERYPELYALPGHSTRVHTVALSWDGKRAASASGDRLVKIWSTKTGARVSILQ